MRFAEMTAPAIRALDRDKTLILAPIAACEQHSRHLPVFTDSILCSAVADGVEKSNSEHILLLPVLWFGASEHHLPTYETMLVELLSPLLRDGFRRVLVLNGHGGNIDPMRVALRRLDVKFPEAVLTGAAYWDLASEEIASLCSGPRKAMGHACEIESSMMMHLRPDLVQKDEIVDDPETTPEGLRGVSWPRDFGRYTHHGAVGYPKFASAETGRLMLEAIIRKVAETAECVRRL
jgi:creatinine amidohydrolase